MPSNITASSVFTEPLQMPNDGEVVDASDFLASTIQGLANRDQYLKDGVDAIVAQLASQLAPLRQVARYSLSASSLADGSTVALTEDLDPGSSFALAGDEITIPATGYYLLHVSGSCTGESTSTGIRIGIIIRREGAEELYLAATRFSTEPTDRVRFAGSKLIAPSTGHVIDARIESTEGDVTLLATYLSIHRIR